MNKILNALVFIAVVGSFSSFAQDSWPRFRNGLTQTGFTDNAGPMTNNEYWSFQVNTSSIFSSPAIEGGYAYFGSLDSNFYCVNSSNGNLVWSYKTNSGIYYSSPAVAAGKVYIGSWDGFLYCLDATTGDSIWSYNTLSASGFNSCPAVIDNKVYFGSNNTYIYCLDANTGAEIWSYKTGMSVWCSPAIVEGRLYVGSFDSKMYCLDAATGDSIWATTASMMIYSSPAVAGDKLYFGTVIGGNAYCLNIADGSIVWQRPLNGAIFSSPAVHNGRMFIGVDQVNLGGGRMFCLDALTGDSLWSIFHSNSGSVYSSPAANDSLIYYGAMNFHAYCVRQTDGEIIWDYPTSDQILTSPALVDNSLYFGTKDGRMVCVKDLNVGLADNTPVSSGPGIYPNPANDLVNISFTLPQASQVEIVVYDIQGRSVAIISNENYPAGTSSVIWNCSNEAGMKVPPGVYICRLTMGGVNSTEKIVVY